MRKLVIVFISFLCFIACREEEEIFPPEVVVTLPDTTSNLTGYEKLSGFYLLNEGIMVRPVTKDIYLTDAFNYVYPGALFCFDRNGKKKWQVRAGDIPAHFALLER
jgi:hypothetical protein